MAIRDAIVLNTTGSNFQAVQSGDTVRIKGDSAELLSIENSSETSVFSVGTSTTSVNIEGNVTSSKPISGSSTSTASFGYFVADTYEGDAREIASTLPRSGDILSGSSQIAADVSGSFISGFTFGATADEFYVGVSGSNSSHSASVSGSSRGVSSGYTSGSDHSHLQVQQIGHIRGVVGLGTWSNVGSLITGRRRLSTSGTTNATVAFGGENPSSLTCTELWDGSNWSSANAMITPYHAGASTGMGVQNAALRAAGFPSTYGNQCTDHWDGTNWSAGGAVIQRRFQTGNAGTVNAGLLFGGRTYTPSLTAQTCTEEYNGTSWSETGATGPAFPLFGGGGLQNAAFAFLYTDHDQYDGTTWSEAASLPISKQQGAAAGTTNSTLTVGGIGPSETLHYDGVSWCAGTSLAQTQYQNAGTGTQGAALATGGGSTPGVMHQCTAVYSAQQTITGSFGRIEAGYVIGNAEDIKGQIPRDAGLVTSSAQLAADISGSWSKGFNFGAEYGKSAYTGVSGSTNWFMVSASSDSGNINRLTSSVQYISGSSFCGSDYTHLLLDAGHIRGMVGNGTWTAGPNLIAGRECLGAAGTPNAALVFGGTPTTGATEKYDGSSWSELGDMVTGRGLIYGIGTDGAAMAIGGWPQDQCTEEWDGTVWSAGDTLTNDNKCRLAAAGTQNAGLAFGGGSANTGVGDCTEEYNGTSWSAGGAMTDGSHRERVGGTGLQDAALAFGGGDSEAGPSPGFAGTEEYNGTTWSEVTHLITPRVMDTGGQAGTQNAALAFGGRVAPAAKTCTEHYDGTSWSEAGALAIAGRYHAGGGTSQAAFSAATDGDSDLTQFWTGNFINTGSFGRIEVKQLLGDATNIVDDIWSQTNAVSSSAQLATVISGSFISGFNFGVTADELYVGVSGSNSSHSASISGSSAGQSPSGSDFNIFGSAQIRGHVGSGVWSAGGAMSAGRYANNKGGTGVENAAIIAGSGPSEYAGNAVTEHYNGTSWTAAGSALSTARRYNSLTGTQNAALAVGGLATWTNKNSTEIYNGATWATTTSIPTVSGSMVTFGTQNAAAAVGMHMKNNGFIYNFNGTSWSTPSVAVSIKQTPSSTSVNGAMAGGSQNSGIVALGYCNGNLVNGFTFDGTSFTATANLNTARNQVGGWGTANSAIAAGGLAPGHKDDTEIWDGTTWSETADLINAGSRGGGSAGVRAESGITTTGGNAPGGLGLTEHWSGIFTNTGSFSRIEAGYLKGDAGNIGAALASGSNVVSGSVTLAADISGSFISGFNFGGTFEDSFTGVSGSTPTTPGVSGSAAHFSSSVDHPTIIYDSGSLHGADFSPQLQYEFGHIRGTMSGATNTFSAGGTLGTARYRVAAAGVVNAALAFAGKAGTPSAASVTCTEEYDGSSWSTASPVDNAGDAHSFGTGTQNAALLSGRGWGSVGQKTEAYDGHVWSELSNSGVYGFNRSLTGTRNAAIKMGGRETLSITEHFNGTVWSVGGEMNAGRQQATALGLENAAMAIGGPGAPGFGANNTCTEHYDGSTWTVAATRITANSRMSGFGTQNEAAIVGGTTDWDNTEHFDGTAWSAGVATPTVRGSAGSSGNTNNGLSFGGYGPAPYPHLSSTEHYEVQYTTTGSFGRVQADYIEGDASEISSALLAASTVKTSSEAFQSEISGSIRGGIDLKGAITSQPIGAWKRVQNSNIPRSGHAVLGNKNSAIAMGDGGNGPSCIATEIYDGVSWTSFANMPNGYIYPENSGDVGSELLFKGKYSGSILNATIKGNGTSFSQDAYVSSTISSMNPTDVIAGSIGTQNDALSLQHHPGTVYTEHYDGMTWKRVSLNTDNHRGGTAKFGTADAAVTFGGHARCRCVDLWDGASWSSGPAIFGDKCAGSAGGTQTDAITIGGNYNAPHDRTSALFDGTTWHATSALGGTISARGDSVGGSANALSHGWSPAGAPEASVWDIYYPLSASFGRVEPKHGIITDRFELKGKHIDDNNTVLLIHSNADNDSVAFSGSMGDTSNFYHSMSFSGSVKHTSSFAKFGRTSLYFGGDGSLEVSGSGTANRDLEFGNGEFTIEYWVRQDAAQVAKTVLRKPGSYVIENETDVNNITFKFNESASISVGSNYTGSVNKWNHVAVVRHEDTLNMFVDGKLRDTRADMTESMGSYGNSLFIGDADLREGTDTAFSGYIDEFRISNIARYNTEFIPEEGRIQRVGSGSAPDSPFNSKKIEAVTFKLPQFGNFDQPAILTQTLFQTDYSSSLSAISGSRTGRSGSGMYIKEENVGTVAGDMWFNRENNSLNFTWESSSYSGGVWAAGGDILTPYDNRGGGTGVPDAAVSFNSGGGAATASINYDGAAWSVSSALILARHTVGAAGTSQNAALAMGGYRTPYTPGMCTETEAYDGMTWTEVGDLITGRKHADGAGAQNAALFIGGYDVAASALSDKTEEYNGSAWSAGGALIAARQVHSAVGEQYAALAIAGLAGGSPGLLTTVEEYNGSVWSAGTAKITALSEGAADGGVGSAIMAGSGVSPRGQTEEYNGVTWKAGTVLITGRQDLESASVGFASTGKGLVFGGRTPGATRATEEYTNDGVKTTLVICALTGSQA